MSLRLSRKGAIKIGKTFSSEEISQIDNICRNLNKYTKKKHHINFNTEEDEDYGRKYFIEQPFDRSYWHQNLRTQFLKYEYIFFDCSFELRIDKLTSVDKKTSLEIMNTSSTGGANDLRIMNLAPFNHSNALNEISALEFSASASNRSLPIHLIEYIKELSLPKKAEKPKYQDNYDRWRKTEINKLKDGPILNLFNPEIKKKIKPKKRSFRNVHISDRILITYNEKWMKIFKENIEVLFKNIASGVK